MAFKLIQSTIEDKPYLSDLRMTVLEKDFERLNLSREHVFQRFQDHFNPDDVFLIEMNEKIIGCIGIVAFENEVELKNFYLEPQFQGKGIGRSILQSVLDTHMDKEKMTLKIFKGSRAKMLYQSLGFSVVKQDKKVETMTLFNRS